MKLAAREKMLVAATGGLVLLVGAYFLLFAGDSRSTEQLVGLRDKLTKDLAEQNAVLRTAKLDRQRQLDWQRRSLPANWLLARSVYDKWLLDLTGTSKLRNAKITASETHDRHDQFVKIIYTMRATASIGDLADFMYGFYTAGYLHQIRTLDVKPLQGSHDLDVTVAIEALALPGAVVKDKLPSEPARGLALKSLADYHKPIAARNMFAPYVAPPPARETRPVVDKPPPPSTINPAERTFVTGFTEVDGVPQVWLMDRLAGKSWTLQVGETFRVNNRPGVVKSIAPDGEAVIEYEGKKRLLRLDDTLRGGVEVKDTVKTGPTPDKLGTAKANPGE